MFFKICVVRFWWNRIGDSLQSLDLNGGEVIVPTDTFVASANAVIKAGGKPVFANIDPDTLCLDPEDVIKRITSETVGIVYVICSV